MILDIIIVICLIVTSLVVWFRTEAFEEYAKLFGADKFFKVRSYKKSRETNALLTYHSFLLEWHDSFFVRLITCPYCLGYWLSLIACLVTERFDLIGIYYVGSLLLYGVTSKAMEE